MRSVRKADGQGHRVQALQEGPQGALPGDFAEAPTVLELREVGAQPDDVQGRLTMKKLTLKRQWFELAWFWSRDAREVDLRTVSDASSALLESAEFQDIWQEGPMDRHGMRVQLCLERAGIPAGDK